MLKEMWERRQLLVLLLAQMQLISIVTANQPPVIEVDLNNLEIPENTPVNTIIGQMRARDPEDFPINYQLTANGFSINSRNGQVTLRRALDYETSRVATAVLSVNSFDDTVQVVTRTVTFRITDVNDVAPQFSTDVFSGAIDETVPNGTVAIASVVATDVDQSGPGLQVECDRERVAAQFAGVCDLFEVQRTERLQVQRWAGQIVLRGRVSFNEKTVWQVPLRAFDGIFTTRASAEIRINDVQNQPPIFISSMNIQTRESPFPNQPVTNLVEAVDQDTTNPRKVRYSIISNPGNLFQIETNTLTGLGSIFTSPVKALDIDRDPNVEDGFVTIVLKAREVIDEAANILGNDSLTTATSTMVISVIGINDNPPTFSQTFVQVNLTEDSPIGSPLPGFAVTVSDIDQGLDSEFSLSLLNYTDVFEVQPTSGKEVANVGIRVRNTSKLDYDGPINNYTLYVIATQKQTDGFHAPVSCTVSIQLVDVNDLSPVFDQASYQFQVSELAAVGTPVTSGISVTDGDSGVFGTAGIRYRLVGNGAERFQIADPSRPVVSVAPCSGTLGLGPQCIDRESVPSYNLFLVATDNLGAGNSNTTSLIITVTDENDNTPAFTSATGSYEFFINEGQTSGSPVFQVSASDADSALSDNSRIQYSLLGDNGTAYNGLWQVLTGGVITATRPVDYEAIPGATGRYELNLQAQDSAPPFRSSVARVLINVIDLNDNAPVFSLPSPVRRSIVEGSVPSLHLIDLVANDNDLASTANGRVSYLIQSGSQDKFTIDSTNGSLYTTSTATFQFETQSQYILIVLAEDSGRPKLQASLRVIVDILDLNNKVPFFPQDPKRVEIFENAAVNSFVTDMRAIDQDASADLQYSILSVTYIRPDRTNTTSNATLFSVNDTTADVVVASRLNRDIVAEATLVLRVRDMNATNIQTATASLIIVILDVNDQGPTFALPWTLASPFYNISIDEEEAIGSYVTVATASDPDGPIAEYRITNDPLSAFTVTSAGAVSLRGRLDFESVESTNFTIVAVDSGSPALSATATVLVNIVNVNDITPTFFEPQYTFTVPESNGTATRANQLLGVVNASDGDKGDFGEFNIQLINTDNFYAVPFAGGAEIYANGSAILNREARQQLVLQLQVSDSPNNAAVRRATSIPLYVQLTDINDNAPVFLVRNYFATIGNNAAIDSPIVTVAATDADLNATLRYALTSSTAASSFRIDPVSGAVTVGVSLKDKSGTVTFTAEVTDGLYTAFCSIQVTILESSRTPPQWLYPTLNDTLQLLEEQYRGLIIDRLRARQDNSSSDSLTRLTFGIIDNGVFTQETPLFRVNPVTGVLTANAILDREATSEHLLNLAVRDQRSPPLESRRLVTVRVIDVDDNEPRFVQNEYSYSVIENAAVNTTVGQVVARDADSGDNAVVSYEIMSGNEGSVFQINSATGEIQIVSSPDREKVARFSLRVGAASGTRSAGASAASVAVVNVTIVDINDNAPAFSKATYYSSLPYTSQFGHLVTTVAATDPDSGDNAAIEYSIADTKSYFQIERDGRVTLASLVPAANVQAHTAVVSARNPNRPGVSSSASIRVWFSDSASESLMVIGRDPDWVAQNLNLFLTQIRAATNANQVFVNRIRYHTVTNGAVDVAKTDLIVSVVGEDNLLLTGQAVASAVRRRAADPSSSASLQFLQLESATTYDEQAGSIDVSLPIVLSLSALGVLLLGVFTYAIVLFFMQKSLIAQTTAQAGLSSLQVLQIQGAQNRNNIAYDNSAYNDA